MSMWREKLYESATRKRSGRDISELVELINSTCGPWMQEANGMTVWRGMREKTIDDWFIKKVRTDRVPMDSSEGEQQRWNARLDHDGCVAQRHNSVFVTGEVGHAGKFGVQYAIYPQGEFHFSWSNEFKDAVGNEEYMDLGYDHVFECDDESLHEAIKSGNEIMIACKSVVCVPIFMHEDLQRGLGRE